MKSDDGYIAYIVNPKSGATSNKVTARRFQEYLVGRKFEVRVSMTGSLEHACELATDAAVDYDCAMVIVVGGDGTAREVAHGLEGSNKPLLIVPQGTENLLVAGRCISSTRGALGAVRVMGICMGTGEAAGTAAALSMHQGCPPRKLDGHILRERLRLGGAQVA